MHPQPHTGSYEQNELALRLHDAIGARNQLAPAIDTALLKEYTSLAARKGGVAVALLKENACTGCHLTNSEDVVHRAARGEIVTCAHCGRILYVR